MRQEIAAEADTDSGPPKNTITPLDNKPPNLRMWARAAIRASIIAGQLEPGVIYPVSYFASQLNVSATPVREALLDLSGQGLVEIAKNKGFRVPQLSDHDLDEIFALRLLVEVPSVINVVGNLSSSDLATCAQLAQQIEASAQLGDLIGFLESDRLFHSALLRPLSNGRLLGIVNGLRDQARLNALPALAGSDRLIASAREHTLLLDAVLQGNRKDAGRLITQHLEHSRGLWAGVPES